MTGSSSLLLGIDLGTSAVKAVLLDERGVLVHAGMEYDSLTPRDGWVEQDPQVWVETAAAVVRKLHDTVPYDTSQVCAIGLSGQMHGTVVVNSQGKPLRHAIIWADQRSQEQVRLLYRRFGEDEILRMTGNPLFPGFMLPTLLWLREHEPETWSNCSFALLPKDYLRYVLTGEFFTDPSDASASGLFDVKNWNWNGELAERVGLDLRLLPQVVPSSAVAGYLRPEMAEVFGLPAGIPVICGGSDQACQATGSGVIEPGQVSCTIGTGGQVLAPVKRADTLPSPRYHLFCHVVPGLWHLEAATLSAGLSLRWLREILGTFTYQQMADLAKNIPAGSEGLFFAPYLLGERTPYMDANLRAGFVGLSIRHKREHLVRAVMEGVVFSLRSGMDLFREHGIEFDRIIAAGGAAQHDLWLQIQADIFDLPVYRSPVSEPAATGAALLAGTGVGLFADVRSAVKRYQSNEKPVLPQKDAVKVYNKLFPHFLQLYPSLKPFSHTPD